VAYLQMAAVVRWKVNDLGKVVPDPDTTTPISVVVQDTGNPDSRIIAAYIRKQLAKPDRKAEERLKEAEELLKEAAHGLLTVTATSRFEVTAPPLPADYDGGPVATIVKALRAVGLGQGDGGQQGQGGGGPPGPDAGGSTDKSSRAGRG
jgi:hypothetical protein